MLHVQNLGAAKLPVSPGTIVVIFFFFFFLRFFLNTVFFCSPSMKGRKIKIMEVKNVFPHS